MKKTISITINNLVFQIEEDAYEKLKKYLDSIRVHYGASDESREILADIESSIAEKFSKKVSVKKQSINLRDIEKVIKIMGTVEEFSEDSLLDSAAKESVRREDGKSAGEFKDSEDGKQKEEIDNNGASRRRKLYRDPDDKIIAGVASGLAAYFGIDPVIIRLIFIALFFANGVGILIYAILWIVMPIAKSSVEKLEMHGKPVDLKRIEQAVKEKSEVVKKGGKNALKNLSAHKGIFYKIINFPIKVLEVIFSFLKKTMGLIGPGLSIFFGVIFIITAFFSILASNIAAGVMIFNINSEYLVSDLPLIEIASQPMYYVGVISFYLIVLIPFVFLLLLGLTMVKRKNVFQALSNGILIGIWMLAIAGGIIAAGDLAPKISQRVFEINRNESVERSFDYADFNKLYIGAYMDAEIKKGDEFSISMAGRAQDLDRLNFNIEEGQLQILQAKREEDGKLCIFCFNKEIKATITMPELKSFVGFKNADVKINDFEKDIYISVGEAAEVAIELMGQNLSCSLSGVDSELLLSGSVSDLECKLDGHARLTAEDLIAKKVKLDQSIYSKAVLDGKAETLGVKLDNHARLGAFNFRTGEIAINTFSYAKAEVYPTKKLRAIANENSRITYKGDPSDKVTEEFKNGEIKHVRILELDDLSEAKFKIKVEPETYAPFMSSARGFTLTADYNDWPGSDNIIFRWETDHGRFVTDWDDVDWDDFNMEHHEFETEEGEIYWTILPEKFSEFSSSSDPVYVYVEAIGDEDKVLDKTQLKLIWDSETGGVFRVEE
ncbi:hypothetical protein DRH27_02450 [Candidatus Falkowbacteria bacterium]|nr:MAG: hypothetical protein DRH27_02450 [Candidatus Falkowbacteria bacterium]